MLRPWHLCWLGVAVACGPHLGKAPGPAEPAESAETTSPPPPEPSRRLPSHATYISQQEYQEPPAELRGLLETPPAPELVLHAGARRLVRVFERGLLPLSELSRTRLPLAGMRINPENLTSDDLTLYTHLELSELDDPEALVRVRPPSGALFGGVSFSPRGDRLLASLVTDEAVHVALVDADSGKMNTLRALSPLSALWGPPCEWIDDSRLLCRGPAERGPAPRIATGPNIFELTAGSTATLTYPNLLRDSNDDALFEHYGSVRLFVVALEGLQLRRAQPRPVQSDAAPDNQAEPETGGASTQGDRASDRSEREAHQPESAAEVAAEKAQSAPATSARPSSEADAPGGQKDTPGGPEASEKSDVDKQDQALLDQPRHPDDQPSDDQPREERRREDQRSSDRPRRRLSPEQRFPTLSRGMILKAEISPNGRYLLQERLERPYPRFVPVSKFPRRLEVLEIASGDVVFATGSRDLPSESTSLPWGPRDSAWDPRAPARLVFLDRRPARAGARESLLFSSAPFSTPPKRLKTGLRRARAWGVTTADTLWLVDSGNGDRAATTYVQEPGGRMQPLATSAQTPGQGDLSQALRRDGDRGPVLEVDGRLFFTTETRSERGALTRLFAWHRSSDTSRAMWRSKPGEHTEVTAVLDPATRNYLIRSETPTIPPYYVESKNGWRRAVTPSAAKVEELEGVTRQLVRYRRNDGVWLSAMLYLPPEFRPGRPVPVVFWIYPRDFNDPEQASRISEHPDRYFEIRGPSRFSVLTQGYALLDDPSMPIVGEITTGRDDFIPQLVSSAEAAIDYLVGMRITEPHLVAVMGRSYGAFAVANLMAHSDLFPVGVALSGAYNRTLTPFGFQKETRTFWQNTDAYVNLSPFFFADQVKGAMLLLHGEMDDNPGTPVFQSERFFAALAGNGMKSRYVSFPFEGHQFRGRKSVYHATGEIIDWLDRHLRNGPAQSSQGSPGLARGRGRSASPEGTAHKSSSRR